MNKTMIIVCTSFLLIGCSTKNPKVTKSAIAGGTVGVLAGAVMGSTVAFANGESGNKLATKAVIFGILVGLAGASIGTSVEFTKEIFGDDKEEKEANQKINNAIKKANQPQEKRKIYHQEKKEVKQKINQPEEKIKIYHKEEIVDVTDMIDEVENIKENETNETIKILNNDKEENVSSQNNNHVIEKTNLPLEKIKSYYNEEIEGATEAIDGTKNIEKNETNDEPVDTSNQVNTIEDEPISVSTDTSTALKEAYSKEIE